MTSLILEFRKNKLGMLSSALLFPPLGSWPSLLFLKELALLPHMGLPESSIAETGWVSLSNSGDQLLGPFGSHTNLYPPTLPSSITTL